MLTTFCALLAVSLPEARAAEAETRSAAGNRLSRRQQLRYQDVVVTREGSRWRGKVIERGEVIRVRLEDQSEVAVPRDQVVSISRELHPGLVHNGMWGLRASPGFELAFASAELDAGLQYGPMMEFALSHNFGGPFEPEGVVVLTPLGPQDGSVTVQVGVGVRYYLQAAKRAKPFTSTQIILYGNRGDLGLRTGPGFLWDITENIGLGINQGVTIVIQVDPEEVAVGYHAVLTVQGRF